MKKLLTLIIFLLLIFSLVSCEFPTITPFGENSDNDTEESTTPSPMLDDSPSAFITNSFSKYFSSVDGQTLTLSKGSDTIDSLYITQYIGKDKIQILEVSGDRFQTVYEFTDDTVFIIYKKEMSNSDTPVNLTIDPPVDSNKEVFLKGPLALGTNWTDSNDNLLEITGIDKTCITKAGEFKTLEITIKNQTNNTITKNYFGENLGLIKSVTRNEADEIISLNQLINID